MRKFTLPSGEDADRFRDEVIRSGGDAFKYEGSTTVVMRGDIPWNYHLQEEEVSWYDALMLHINWG